LSFLDYLLNARGNHFQQASFIPLKGQASLFISTIARIGSADHLGSGDARSAFDSFPDVDRAKLVMILASKGIFCAMLPGSACSRRSFLHAAHRPALWRIVKMPAPQFSRPVMGPDRIKTPISRFVRSCYGVSRIIRHGGEGSASSAGFSRLEMKTNVERRTLNVEVKS
jgi:hypothetical protein